MKRVVQFRVTNTGYACFENNEIIFEISKTELQFNVRDFYQAFYGEDKDFDNIVIENKVENDKTADRVYKCIISLVSDIKNKLSELSYEVKKVMNDKTKN